MGALADKIAVVTGSSSGFGEATARALIAAGAKVIITGRRKKRLERLAKELGPNALPITFDVRDASAVAQAFAGLPKPWRAIDILVNNAGLALGTGSFEKQTHVDMEQMVQTNILGVIYATEAILPGMIKRGAGHIVNVGSIAGVYPYPGANVYGGTKAFVAQFSLNLRADLVDKNIRVTCVEPGLAETEFSIVRLHGDEKAAKDVYKGTQPLSGEDIANNILWVLQQPENVNINRIEIMPTCQAFSPFAIARK